MTREELLLELEQHERALLDLLPTICPSCRSMRLSDDDVTKSAPHAARIVELRKQLEIPPVARPEPVAFALGGSALDDFTQPVAAWKLTRGAETTSGAFCRKHVDIRVADGWTAEAEDGWFSQSGTVTPCPDCQLS